MVKRAIKHCLSNDSVYEKMDTKIAEQILTEEC